MTVSAHESSASRVGFVKAHACGNDFLIIEDRLARNRHAALARRLCHRNTGIGADGIEFLARRPDGTLFLRLFNADGSEAELSGNGTRCVAAWLAASEGLRQTAFSTHGGLRTCRVVRQGEDAGEKHARSNDARRGDAAWWIESGMGIPRIMPRTIEISSPDDPASAIIIEGAMVNVGNPHFVIFTGNEDFSVHGLAWQALGARIAVDPVFRHGANVEFVRVLSPTEIAFRIYERGCGPTTSSGTGTCASAAASIALRNTARELSAVAQGGTQTVVWAANDAEMLLTGPAEIVCTGEVDFA